MRFFVMVQGDEIIVTSPTGFRAAYFKRPYHPQLVLRRSTQTDDQELLAQAWQAGARAWVDRVGSYAITRSADLLDVS